MSARRPQLVQVRLLIAFLAIIPAGTSPTFSVSGDSTSGAAPSPLEAFQRAITEAEENLRLGELQLVESRYRTALFEGWMILGSIAEADGNLAEARRAYETAIDSVVEMRRARIALVRVLRGIRDYDQAEDILRLLIAEDKNDFLARRLLSDTLADAGDDEKSIQELEQLVFMNPDDLETAYFLATAYLAQERLDEADFLMARLAEAIPGAQTQVLIGRAYRDYEQFDRARQALDAAIEMDPEVKRARFYRGTVDLRQHGREALEGAMNWFEQELAVNPDDPMTNHYLGMALVDGRRYAEAIPRLETASRWPKVRADALQFLGKALLGENRLEDAIETSRRGLEALQEDVGDRLENALTEMEARQMSQFHYQLAQILRRVGEREQAAVHFDAAKVYQVEQKETAEELLDRYFAAGTGEDTSAEGTLNREPTQPGIDASSSSETRTLIATALARSYLNLGVLKVRAQQPGFAANLFQQAADLAPDLEQVQYSLGVARFNAGQFARAAAPLELALERRPGDDQLAQMLALAWFNSEEYDKAVNILRDLESMRSNPGLQYTYGVALVRTGRSEEAEEVFAELLSRNADWPELNVMLAKVHAKDGDFESAVDLLKRALVLNPGVAEAHATLGEIHMRKGELEEAERELESELQVRPGDSGTTFMLATVLDMAQRPDEARLLLSSLLGREPRLGKARYLLGKILLSQGSPKEALEQLQAAVGLMPDDANVRYQLGQAYQKLGLRDEARREFDTFRQLKNERR